MEWNVTVREKLGFAEIEATAAFVGGDLLVCVRGGERPHIGCTVLSEPRPSLTGDGSTGATSSILNRSGHKDEVICRCLAEKICRTEGIVVVCTGGFHTDGILPEQIDEVRQAVCRIGVRLSEAVSEYRKHIAEK